jgi:hypothetical protein
MEEFFKDLYHDFQNRPADGSLRGAYIALVSAYMRVIRETTNWLCEDSRLRAPIGRLIAAAAEQADTVSVITFNHDLVIENEIFKRARLRQRWCLHNGYGAIGSSMSALRGAAPLFPEHSSACDHTRPLMVYKLHGSLNWIIPTSGCFSDFQPVDRTDRTSSALPDSS